jgi:hypothetical protein
MRFSLLTLVLATAVAAAAVAQEPSIELGPLECLPNEHNASFSAAVTDEPGGSRVQFQFRRLNPTGAWYYVEMFPAGNGNYWTVIPKPEDRPQTELFDDWWEILQNRDWIAGRDRDWLEDWLESQEHEAAEYRVAIVDSLGNILRESEISLVEVLDADWDPDAEERDRFEGRRSGRIVETEDTERLVGDAEDNDCPVLLTEMEFGWAGNMTVGETTEAQIGNPVFHWLCDGIVTRLGANRVYRADEFCRSCVVGGFFPPSLAPAIVSSDIIRRNRPEEVTPSQQ